MLEIPTTLHEFLAGRYVLKHEIGRGGGATVYLAHDIRHERLVAVKILHPALSHALGAQRFLREIRVTAGLQHPHILSIHDSGEVDQQLFFVMPYIEGDTLRQRLTTDNRLSCEETVRIGREVAGALAYAHERGVVHRDIKPENILFSGGHAVLADFGIARAIDRAHEKITKQGTITGTPAYMSPEQARDRAFDGRSDVYSLACVLYEALAGVPPFVGDTPQALLQQRISRPAPLLREYRHDVPPPIESVIAKALATSPDDRYDDARAFSAALSTAIGNSGPTTLAGSRRRSLRRSPLAWAAGISILVAGGAATSPGARDRLGVFATHVDTAQYAVVPFAYVGGAAPAPDAEPVAQALYSSMREWSGLALASDVRVLDALRDRSDRSLEGMQAVARSVHAGRLVWGRVWVHRDSLRVRVTVYDALGGTPLREATVTDSREHLMTRVGGMSQLVADLLRVDGHRPLDPGTDVGTRSLAAWRAYEEARRALETWHVPAATNALQRAVAADPGFPRARAWLAQLLVWHDAPRDVWGPHAGVAMRGRATLPAREALLADALQSLYEGRTKQSCDAYDELRRADSLDATAWLGLAYCQGLNRRVVRNTAVTSGWAFEGSVHAAQQAYAQAVRIAPRSFTAVPFDIVVNKLFIMEPFRVRAGVSRDSALFFALPDLAGDTISFTAYSAHGLATKRLEVLAPHHERSLARNRQTLLGILAMHIQDMPGDPDAFEALAHVLEMRDEITGTPNGGYSALSALERAKALATDATQRARLGASDVRLHLKLGDFSRTVALGDSLLASAPRATGATASFLVGVSALLGREQDAVRYARAAGVSPSMGADPLVPVVADVATAHFMRTALGVCDDSVRTLQRTLGKLLEDYVAPAQRARASDQLLERPRSFVLGCVGPGATFAITAPTIAIVHINRLIDRGEPTRARVALDSVQAQRTAMRAGEFAVDATLAEAWTRAALGDTAAAIRQLDRTFTALPTLSAHVVFEPGMAAAIGRGMVLRADLAARRGDRGAAALWAGRVLTLWMHADRSLAPTLARMRALAGTVS
ncbi:MAG TPA: serine/threonine-protein kinase [Gemmatimonadaceae bacterium]|nr:serine/threonine-protein kinase [Gemmatimonadaceae bacterium]